MSLGSPLKSTGLKKRYYTCRCSWNHGGKFNLNDAERLESAFVDLLRGLGTQRSLSKWQPKPKAIQDLSDSVAEKKRKQAALDKEKQKVWDLFASGKVREEDVQERLDVIAAKQDVVAAEVSALSEQLTIANAAKDRVVELKQVLAKAPQAFVNGTEEESRSIARVIALEFGGLCVEKDGSLSLRTPAAMPSRQRMASR